MKEDPEFYETPEYEPSPLQMSGLDRTSIVVLPKLLEEAFGYKGNRRYVSFHWSPKHNKLFLCDGLLRGQMSDSTVWPRFLTHPVISPHLQHFNADFKRVETFEFSGKVVPLTQMTVFPIEEDALRMNADVLTSCLLLDRRDAALYVGSWSGALTFHSLVGDEVFEGERCEASGETARNPEEPLITWLNERLDDPDQLFNVAATFHRFSQYQQSTGFASALRAASSGVG